MFAKTKTNKNKNFGRNQKQPALFPPNFYIRSGGVGGNLGVVAGCGGCRRAARGRLGRPRASTLARVWGRVGRRPAYLEGRGQAGARGRHRRPRPVRPPRRPASLRGAVGSGLEAGGGVLEAWRLLGGVGLEAWRVLSSRRVPGLVRFRSRAACLDALGSGRAARALAGWGWNGCGPGVCRGRVVVLVGLVACALEDVEGCCDFFVG